jgi:hypothetical protein
MVSFLFKIDMGQRATYLAYSGFEVWYWTVSMKDKRLSGVDVPLEEEDLVLGIAVVNATRGGMAMKQRPLVSFIVQRKGAQETGYLAGLNHESRTGETGSWTELESRGYCTPVAKAGVQVNLTKQYVQKSNCGDIQGSFRRKVQDCMATFRSKLQGETCPLRMHSVTSELQVY